MMNDRRTITAWIMVALGGLAVFFIASSHQAPFSTNIFRTPSAHAAMTVVGGGGSKGGGGGVSSGGGTGGGAQAQGGDCLESVVVSGYPTSVVAMVGMDNIGTTSCVFSYSPGCGQIGQMQTNLSVVGSGGLASFSSTPNRAGATNPPSPTSFPFNVSANMKSQGTATTTFTCYAHIFGGDGSHVYGQNDTTSTLTVWAPITSCSMGVATTTQYFSGGQVVTTAGPMGNSVTAIVGDAIQWQAISSSTGGTYYVNGTKNGVTDVNDVLSGVTNQGWQQTFTCADLGNTYTRSIHVVGQFKQGNCTSTPVTVTVTDPNGICKPPPPVCTAVKGFASSCSTPYVPSSQVDAFVNPVATTTSATFTVSVTVPGGTSSVWNRAYYWNQASSSWTPFILGGTAYKGTSCSKPSKGCWLTNQASTTLTVSTSTASPDGSLFVLTYDDSIMLKGKTKTWRGSPCLTGSGSCWRLSVFPPSVAELMDRVTHMTSFQDMAAVAVNEGFLVEDGYSLQDSTLYILQPFNHAIIDSYSEYIN